MALFHSKSLGVWQQLSFPQVISVLPLFLTKDKSSQKHSISGSKKEMGEQVSTSDACNFTPSLQVFIWKAAGWLPLYGTASLLPYPWAQLDALSHPALWQERYLWSATAQVWQALKIRPIAFMPLPAKPCESKWAWVTELEWVRSSWDTHFIAFPGY